MGMAPGREGEGDNWVRAVTPCEGEALFPGKCKGVICDLFATHLYCAYAKLLISCNLCTACNTVCQIRADEEMLQIQCVMEGFVLRSSFMGFRGSGVQIPVSRPVKSTT